MKDWQHWKTPLMSNSTNGNDVPDSAIAYRASPGFKPQREIVNPECVCTCGYRASMHAHGGSGECEIAGIHCAKFRHAEATVE